METIEKEILIKADPAAVWEVLTNPDRMKEWMGEPEMNIEVITDWEVGGPVMIRGFHHVKFVNRGTVLQSEPGKLLKYNFLSSVSRLPDKPENYTVVEFRLVPSGDHTQLKLTLGNFPTESIYKHNEFYWKTTIEILKRSVESH
jgi:uncharacterized protein YndB with AHSA1/START domain